MGCQQDKQKILYKEQMNKRGKNNSTDSIVNKNNIVVVKTGNPNSTSTTNFIDLNEDLISVSKIFMEFICKQKLFYIKIFFEIFQQILEILQLVLEKRQEIGMKFYVVNFDKFYYDKNKNIIILEDKNIFKSNYNFKCIMTESSYKLYNKKYKSIQPLIYESKANEMLIKLNLYNNEAYSYSNCKIFYSYLILNFLNRIFRKTALSSVKYVAETYDDFRRNLIYDVNNIYNDFDVINLDTIQSLVSSICIENIQIKEIMLYYDYEYTNKKSFDINASDFSYLSTASDCNLTEYLQTKQFSVTFYSNCSKTGHTTFRSSNMNDEMVRKAYHDKTYSKYLQKINISSISEQRRISN